MAENAVLVELGMALRVEKHMLQAPILRTSVDGKEVVDYSVTTWHYFGTVRLRCGAFQFLPSALLSVCFLLYLQSMPTHTGQKGFCRTSRRS